MREAELQRKVLKLAKDYDVLAYHVYSSKSATSAGFPDLVLAGKEHTMFVELKGFGGRLSPEQRIWKKRLQNSGEDYELWTDQDLTSGHIAAVMEWL